MLLQVENLSFSYNKERQIFRDTSFALDRGNIMSILGPNGAGKSTLLNCIANILSPDSGSISFDGKDLQSLKYNQVANYIGYVPQIHYAVYGFLVRDYISMGRAPKIGIFSQPSKEDFLLVEEAMDKMEISHLAYKPYTEISGGERQKACIAKVLVQKPEIIILDEPTAHLDYGSQYKTVNMIKSLSSEGFAVIMTTHQPEDALIMGDYTGVLKRDGSFTFGNSKEIISEELLSDIYKIEIKMPFVAEVGKKVICPL